MVSLLIVKQIELHGLYILLGYFKILLYRPLKFNSSPPVKQLALLHIKLFDNFRNYNGSRISGNTLSKYVLLLIVLLVACFIFY